MSMIQKTNCIDCFQQIVNPEKDSLFCSNCLKNQFEYLDAFNPPQNIKQNTNSKIQGLQKLGQSNSCLTKSSNQKIDNMFSYQKIQKNPKLSSQNSIQCPFCNILNQKQNQYCINCLIELASIKNQIKLQKQELIRCDICYQQITKNFYQNHYKSCLQSLQFLQNQYQWQVQGQHKRQNLNQMRQNQLQDDKRLTDIQIKAINHMHKSSKNDQLKYKSKLQQRFKRIGYSKQDLQNLQHYIQNYAPIIVHFHAERFLPIFVKDTHYRNLFETKTSCGSTSTDWRAKKQNSMFNNIYKNAKPFQRIKYGVINFTNDPKGVHLLKQYGTSYFLLKDNVRQRCTIVDDSCEKNVQNMGTLRYSYKVLDKMSDNQLISALKASRGLQQSSTVTKKFKQIQIHGPIQFAFDISRVYISRSDIEKNKDLKILMEQFCTKNKIQYDLIEDKGANQGNNVFSSSQIFRPQSASIFGSNNIMSSQSSYNLFSNSQNNPPPIIPNHPSFFSRQPSRNFVYYNGKVSNQAMIFQNNNNSNTQLHSQSNQSNFNNNGGIFPKKKSKNNSKTDLNKSYDK